MSKHKKSLVAEAPESRLSEKPVLPEFENRLDGEPRKPQGQAKKEINGIWIAVFMLGLLLFLFLQHWLRQ